MLDIKKLLTKILQSIRSLTINKQDNLTAGNWINLSGNIISAKSMESVSGGTTDFNQLTTPGYYGIGSADGLTNGPDGTKYFQVVVFATLDGSTIRQFAWPTASNASTFWMRTYRSSWGSWYSIDNHDTPLFKWTRYTYTYSCAANSSVNITKVNLGLSVPSGFSMAGYTGISTANANVIPRSWNPWASQTGASIVLRNVSSTAANNQTLTVDVLYLRTSNF